MQRNTGSDSDIHSMEFPLNTSTTQAPAPITTQSDERMPAWSPDGLQLGFVRQVNGRRKLGIYDLTPGLQTIVNGLVDIGAGRADVADAGLPERVGRALAGRDPGGARR